MGTSLSHYSLFSALLLVTDWLQGKACNTSWNFLFLLQPLDKSGYSRVKFGPPDLFVFCSIEGTSHNQSCLFTSTSISSELESGEIVWRIPSGIKTHARIVSVVTFILALLSTLLINFDMYILFRCQTSQKSEAILFSCPNFLLPLLGTKMDKFWLLGTKTLPVGCGT